MAFITKSVDRDRVSIAHGFKLLLLDFERQSKIDWSIRDEPNIRQMIAGYPTIL